MAKPRWSLRVWGKLGENNWRQAYKRKPKKLRKYQLAAKEAALDDLISRYVRHVYTGEEINLKKYYNEYKESRKLLHYAELVKSSSGQ